nr:unnamed protein product [Callosobruchus analis]
MPWRRLGRTVRRKGRIERSWRHYLAETEGRWDEALPDVVWGLNNTPNASTRFAPACLMLSHSRSRVADLAGELASDKSMAIGEGDIPRNMANVPGTRRMFQGTRRPWGRHTYLVPKS